MRNPCLAHVLLVGQGPCDKCTRSACPWAHGLASSISGCACAFERRRRAVRDTGHRSSRGKKRGVAPLAALALSNQGESQTANLATVRLALIAYSCKGSFPGPCFTSIPNGCCAMTSAHPGPRQWVDNRFGPGLCHHQRLPPSGYRSKASTKLPYRHEAVS